MRYSILSAQKQGVDPHKNGMMRSLNGTGTMGMNEAALAVVDQMGINNPAYQGQVRDVANRSDVLPNNLAATTLALQSQDSPTKEHLNNIRAGTVVCGEEKEWLRQCMKSAALDPQEHSVDDCREFREIYLACQMMK